MAYYLLSSKSLPCDEPLTFKREAFESWLNDLVFIAKELDSKNPSASSELLELADEITELYS